MPAPPPLNCFVDQLLAVPNLEFKRIPGVAPKPGQRPPRHIDIDIDIFVVDLNFGVIRSAGGAHADPAIPEMAFGGRGMPPSAGRLEASL
jgi:hypothetical protein